MKKMYLQVPGWFTFDFNVLETKTNDETTELRQKMIEAFEKDNYEIIAEFALNAEQIKKARKACEEFLRLTKYKDDLVAGIIYKEKENV